MFHRRIDRRLRPGSPYRPAIWTTTQAAAGRGIVDGTARSPVSYESRRHSVGPIIQCRHRAASVHDLRRRCHGRSGKLLEPGRGGHLGMVRLSAGTVRFERRRPKTADRVPADRDPGRDFSRLRLGSIRIPAAQSAFIHPGGARSCLRGGAAHHERDAGMASLRAGRGPGAAGGRRRDFRLRYAGSALVRGVPALPDGFPRPALSRDHVPVRAVDREPGDERGGVAILRARSVAGPDDRHQAAAVGGFILLRIGHHGGAGYRAAHGTPGAARLNLPCRRAEPRTWQRQPRPVSPKARRPPRSLHQSRCGSNRRPETDCRNRNCPDRADAARFPAN